MDQPPEPGDSTRLPEPDSPQTSTPNSLFIGPSGLRVPWRLAIYIAGFYFLTYALAFVATPLVALLPDNSMQNSYLLLIGDIIEFIAAIVPAIILAHMEQRPFSSYGMSLSHTFGVNFWLGVLWGVLSLSLLLTLMRIFGLFYFGGLAIHGVRALKFAVFWGAVFLIVAFYEEFFSRGYTQFTLTEGIGFWPAALALSAIFGVSHLRNPGETWNGALGAAVIGFFWCFTLRRTGTIWFGIGMHAAWDWAETFLYSVPDSGLVAPGHLLKSSFHGSRWLTGGSVGPEGSVLLLVLIAALWIVFDRLYPEIKYQRAGADPVVIPALDFRSGDNPGGPMTGPVT